jgi:hypothetical protein
MQAFIRDRDPTSIAQVRKTKPLLRSDLQIFKNEL